jgi:hypothetical protein
VRPCCRLCSTASNVAGNCGALTRCCASQPHDHIPAHERMGTYRQAAFYRSQMVDVGMRHNHCTPWPIGKLMRCGGPTLPPTFASSGTTRGFASRYACLPPRSHCNSAPLPIPRPDCTLAVCRFHTAAGRWWSLWRLLWWWRSTPSSSRWSSSGCPHAARTPPPQAPRTERAGPTHASPHQNTP